MRWDVVKALGVGALMSAVALGVAFSPAPTRHVPYEHAASSRWGQIVKDGKAKTPVVEGTFHGEVALADTAFKEAVERSLAELERTSCGLLKLEVVWDFVPKRDMLRAAIRGDMIIMGVESDTMKDAFDGKDSELLGLAHQGAKWVFLVTDRIDEPELATWVVGHELSHTIGMDHVELGLMQEHAPPFPREAVTWERDDLREFCRVWSCNIDMFDDCRER